MTDYKNAIGRVQSGFLGSLRDALAAASRDDQGPRGDSITVNKVMPRLDADVPASVQMAALVQPPMTAAINPTSRPEVLGPSAADAAREARGGSGSGEPMKRTAIDTGVTESDAPTTRVIRRPQPPVTPGVAQSSAQSSAKSDERTRVLRGKQKIGAVEFEQDPVVGWLVIVGGPGLGAFRPIFEGNNTLGRGKTNRIAVDFGDDSISTDEQAYIRYDSTDRSFLFVPNLSKTNVVSVNDKKPTGAVALVAMDVITVGRTQLAFVPFCGEEFDWSEIIEEKA